MVAQTHIAHLAPLVQLKGHLVQHHALAAQLGPLATWECLIAEPHAKPALLEHTPQALAKLHADLVIRAITPAAQATPSAQHVTEGIIVLEVAAQLAHLVLLDTTAPQLAVQAVLVVQQVNLQTYQGRTIAELAALEQCQTVAIQVV